MWQVGLDEAGAGPGCAVLNQEGDLIVGRDEAFYFNTLEGRGPCFACEGGAGCSSWLPLIEQQSWAASGYIGSHHFRAASGYRGSRFDA